MELNLFDMFKDTYYDRGYEMVGGARIKSWKAGGHGLQTFLEVLQNSSNPGFVEISRRMGLDNEYAYVKKFGFGEKTGIDLPGESKGIMFKKSAMGEVEQATVALSLIHIWMPFMENVIWWKSLFHLAAASVIKKYVM